MMVRWILPAFVLVLAACSSDDNVAATNTNIAPANYRQEIVDTLQKLFISNETASVSNAFVSDPVVTPDVSLYTACVRYTAHGATPGDIGNAERIAYFHHGRLNQLIPAEEGQCNRAAYKPFPELEKLCLGKACTSRDEKSGGVGLGTLFGR